MIGADWALDQPRETAASRVAQSLNQCIGPDGPDTTTLNHAKQFEAFSGRSNAAGRKVEERVGVVEETNQDLVLPLAHILFARTPLTSEAADRHMSTETLALD
jgi:hypothetical protein